MLRARLLGAAPVTNPSKQLLSTGSRKRGQFDTCALTLTLRALSHIRTLTKER